MPLFTESEIPPLRNGRLLVIATDPPEAWVANAIDGLATFGFDVTWVRARTASGLPNARLSRWRIRHAGEPSALEPASPVAAESPAPSRELRAVISTAALIVDLSGQETYRSVEPGGPPVVRVRFGERRSLHAGPSFGSRLGARRPINRIAITLEWIGGTALLREAPVVVNRTSYALTRNAALWKAAVTVPRAIRALFTAHDPRPHSATTFSPFHAQPHGRAREAVRLAVHAAGQLVTRERWGVALQPIEQSGPVTHAAIQAPSLWVEDALSIADPCLFEHSGTTYLFVERVRPGKPGAIAVARIGPDGRTEAMQNVLVERHHLSYPSVFEDEGDVYLLPESTAARNVRLFRAADFPVRWTQAATLLDDIVAFDPTLHHSDGGYWLFACVAPVGRGQNDELWLFHSPALTGPWQPHAANPVVEDPRSARPAGALFLSGDRLIRPSQDCSLRYGHRIVLNEVLELGARRYRERPIATIEPTWSPGLIATHTISRSNRWQALDGARRVVDPFSPRAGAHL